MFFLFFKKVFTKYLNQKAKYKLYSMNIEIMKYLKVKFYLFFEIFN